MFTRIVANAVEWVCMGLMVVLSLDLLLGVFSRYVMVRTFTWSHGEYCGITLSYSVSSVTFTRFISSCRSLRCTTASR